MKVIVTSEQHLKKIINGEIEVVGLILHSPSSQLEKVEMLPDAIMMIDSLTPRETEVLQKVSEGYSNKEIAELLGIGQRTVEYHRTNIYDKIEPIAEGRERWAIIAAAKKLGLIGE